MEINYNQMKSTRMCLNEALKSFSGEISYLTLKDGTCIEIMPDDYHREKDYTDNQLQMGGENEDEFVEEKIDGNMYNMNYNNVIPKQPGPLRGRGKGKVLGKSLRKTVLKSIDGSEQEKKLEGQKLRNLKDKQNQNLNDIISFSENNDFLQCANCLKFFVSDEKEDKSSTQTTDKNVQNNNQQIPPQNQPKIPTNQPKVPTNQQKLPYPHQQIPTQYPQQIPPQPGRPSKDPKHNQKKDTHNYPQQQPYPQQQFYPQQNQGYPNYPTQHQKYTSNMNMGTPQKQNQPQQYYPPQVQPGKHNQQQQQQYYQQIPFQQNTGYTSQQQQFYNQKNMPGFFPGHPGQGINAPFGGANQVFRARRKEVEEDYDDELDDYDMMENNYVTEQYYPISAKKVRNNSNYYGEYPLKKHTSQNVQRKILPRNLSQGLKKSISSRNKIGYTDNNLTEYMIDDGNGDYYQYSYYQKKNLIPYGRTKQVNNHRCVNVKVTRNVPYQYQEYQDYQEEYEDY